MPGAGIQQPRPRRTAAADLVSLDELLRESDIVTLHLPLEPGDAPPHRARADRDDEAGRVSRQHRARGAGRHRRAGRGAGRRKAWAARRWTCWKARKGSSTSTARTDRSTIASCSRLQRLPNVIITPHTAYYTRRALHDTVEQTLINCLRLRTRTSNDERTAEDRDPVRGLLGGARRVGEVRDGGRGEHRHAQVRADLHRHHQDRRLEDVRAAASGMGGRRRADEP